MSTRGGASVVQTAAPAASMATAHAASHTARLLGRGMARDGSTARQPELTPTHLASIRSTSRPIHGGTYDDSVHPDAVSRAQADARGRARLRSFSARTRGAAQRRL